MQRFQDEMGYWWCYDPSSGKVFMEAAEDDVPDNGYYVDSFEEAKVFIEKEYGLLQT